MEKPLISIIMAAYNEELYIKEAIQSILLQTYQNIEVLVIDNLSTDSTVSIVEELRSHDSRVKLLQCTIKGPAATRNMAIKEAKGSFIAVMDADDVVPTDRIAQLYGICSKSNEAVVGSNVQIVNSKLTPVRELIYPEHNKEIRKAFSRLFNRSVIMPGTIMVHAQLLKQNLYNETFTFLEDWDLILRLASNKDVVFSNAQDFLYQYRLNEGSVTYNWKDRNQYNALILINQWLRSQNKSDYSTLEELKKSIPRRPVITTAFITIVIMKFFQHSLWRIKTKLQTK
ncbi:MAG: glycosyltransferase [Fibrobacterales bacterium]